MWCGVVCLLQASMLFENRPMLDKVQYIMNGNLAVKKKWCSFCKVLVNITTCETHVCTI